MNVATPACPECNKPTTGDGKFCGFCGATIAAAGPSEATVRFGSHVAATLRDGAKVSAVVDGLLEDAAAFGLRPGEAIGIIERTAADDQATGPQVECWYDQEQSGAGVAGGNTLLVFRVANRVTRSLDRVTCSIVHPVTQELMTLPPIQMLVKGGEKETDITLAFDRVGRHSIRDGFLEVQELTGVVHTYRFASAVRLTAENSGAARTHIHSVSQTIQTHGGGVISADGLQAGGAAKSANDRWEPVRLVWCDASELTELRARLLAEREAQRASAAAAAVAAEAAASVAAAAAALPEAPMNLTAIPRSPHTIALQWNDLATNESGFCVERSNDGVSFVRFATTGPNTAAYVVDGLTPGTSYLFRVRAFNDAGSSPYSNTASVMTMPASPPPTPHTAGAPAVAPSPVVTIVNNVAAASAPAPAPLSDKAVKTTSIMKVVITLIVAALLLFITMAVVVSLL